MSPQLERMPEGFVYDRVNLGVSQLATSLYRNGHALDGAEFHFTTIHEHVPVEVKVIVKRLDPPGGMPRKMLDKSSVWVWIKIVAASFLLPDGSRSGIQTPNWTTEDKRRDPVMPHGHTYYKQACLLDALSLVVGERIMRASSPSFGGSDWGGAPVCFYSYTLRETCVEVNNRTRLDFKTADELE